MKKIYTCKECGRELARKRPTGYCNACKNRLMPAWLGKKRPDAVWQHLPHCTGKDNIFSQIKFKGVAHANWKGDDVGYQALHTWVARELGRPNMCESCGRVEDRPYFIQWANKSGKYLRELSDWIRLCARCHYHYDRDYEA